MKDNLQFESINNFINEDGPLDNLKAASSKIVGKLIGSMPRAIRYKKARLEMRKYNKQFQVKMDRVFKKFLPTLISLSNKIEGVYNVLKERYDDAKAANTTNDISTEEKVAINRLRTFQSDMKKLYDKQFEILDSAFQKLLDSYTKAIEKRIQEKGYIINVQLSDTGQGELNATWALITNELTQKFNNKKAELITDPTVEKIEAINAELETILGEYGLSSGSRYGRAAFAGSTRRSRTGTGTPVGGATGAGLTAGSFITP